VPLTPLRRVGGRAATIPRRSWGFGGTERTQSQERTQDEVPHSVSPKGSFVELPSPASKNPNPSTQS
jgi:hypothetical protein